MEALKPADSCQDVRFFLFLVLVFVLKENCFILSVKTILINNLREKYKIIIKILPALSLKYNH